MATRTIPVSGNGTGTLTFQNPGPDVLDIESVLALIDTSGAGDTIPTLTVTSPAGNDVAAVPQGSPVAGGGQGRATWALRLAEDGGGGGGTLETTDGVAVVHPTTELFIGAGLALGAPGAGVATLAERQVPFFVARAGDLAIPDGGSLNIDFHTGPFVDAWTNDVPAQPGYRTAEGAAFANSTAWTGDNFRASTGLLHTGAFAIRPDRPGVYLVTVTGAFRALGGAGTIDVLTQTNAAGQPRSGTSQRFELVGSTMDYAITVPLVYFTLPFVTVTNIEVVIGNNAGAPSDPPNTTVEVTAYRLSPA